MSPTEPLLINCGSHGDRISAVVCRHMLDTLEPAVGIVENNDDPNDLQAWCFACEEKYLEEGDLTDAFREFNDMVLVCVACYAEIKERHTLPAQ